jgi:hypothetical protein
MLAWGRVEVWTCCMSRTDLVLQEHGRVNARILPVAVRVHHAADRLDVRLIARVARQILFRNMFDFDFALFQPAARRVGRRQQSEIRLSLRTRQRQQKTLLTRCIAVG